MEQIRDPVFAVDAAILIVMLFGAAWSVGYPAKRIWPPPSKGSWQQRLTWALFLAVFGFNAVLLIAVFAVTPLAEELWLEEQYGQEYVDYRRGTSRFL